MAFKLPEHIQEKVNAMRAAEAGAKATFANLDDADLAASALFWMQHCEAPKRIAPGQPVYDSTFWHAIVPEMIRRLSERG
jgi:hypothetical protein